MEATNLSSGYCRRHYENFRRVYKHTSGVLKQKGVEGGDKAHNLLSVAKPGLENGFIVKKSEQPLFCFFLSLPFGFFF